MFMRFSQKYETERLELKEKISAYRKHLSEVDEMQLGKEKFIAAVRKFMQMDKLTAPLLQELIDRIDVYEVTGTGKGFAVGNLQFHHGTVVDGAEPSHIEGDGIQHLKHFLALR